jgi:hypothetical protein
VEATLRGFYSLSLALLLILLLSAVPLEAADVQEACRSDFNRYCGRYDPEGLHEVNWPVSSTEPGLLPGSRRGWVRHPSGPRGIQAPSLNPFKQRL